MDIVQNVEVHFVGDFDVTAIGLDHHGELVHGDVLTFGGHAFLQGGGINGQGSHAEKGHMLTVAGGQRALLGVLAVYALFLRVLKELALVVVNNRRSYARGIGLVQVIHYSHGISPLSNQVVLNFLPEANSASSLAKP